MLHLLLPCPPLPHPTLPRPPARQVEALDLAVREHHSNDNANTQLQHEVARALQAKDDRVVELLGFVSEHMDRKIFHEVVLRKKNAALFAQQYRVDLQFVHSRMRCLYPRILAAQAIFQSRPRPEMLQKRTHVQHQSYNQQQQQIQHFGHESGSHGILQFPADRIHPNTPRFGTPSVHAQLPAQSLLPRSQTIAEQNVVHTNSSHQKLPPPGHTYFVRNSTASRWAKEEDDKITNLVAPFWRDSAQVNPSIKSLMDVLPGRTSRATDTRKGKLKQDFLKAEADRLAAITAPAANTVSNHVATQPSSAFWSRQLPSATFSETSAPAPSRVSSRYLAVSVVRRLLEILEGRLLAARALGQTVSQDDVKNWLYDAKPALLAEFGSGDGPMPIAPPPPSSAFNVHGSAIGTQTPASSTRSVRLASNDQEDIEMVDAYP